MARRMFQSQSKPFFELSSHNMGTLITDIIYYTCVCRSACYTRPTLSYLPLSVFIVGLFNWLCCAAFRCGMSPSPHVRVAVSNKLEPSSIDGSHSLYGYLPLSHELWYLSNRLTLWLGQLASITYLLNLPLMAL